LTIRPDYRPDDAIAPLLIGCFGAQACIAGLFAAFSIFTRTTFLAYGIGVLPFFGFNIYFYFVEPVFNELILLDAAGNAIFVVLCFLGYRQLSQAPH
jgi:polyferredoxin